MSTFHPRRILCPVDLSLFTSSVLEWAGLFAARYGSNVEILHAAWVDLPPYFTHSQIEMLNAQLSREEGAIKESLEAAVSPLINLAVTFSITVQEGRATGVIERFSERPPDLTIMGSHGRSGVPRLLLGSVSENIVRGAKSPVLVVKSSDGTSPTPRIQSILCPVNFTEHARASLDVASRIAADFGAKLIVLHAVEDKEEAFETSDLLCRWAGEVTRHRCESIDVVVDGSAAEQVLVAARERQVDLIVIASERRPLLEFTTIGTTTERVMRHSDCSVLVLPD